MDLDSSSKFIGSLTKFLQSLCNGYVEFQKGVELVGHIYLNIDTGEKVDYILHERVSKNDENSVSFVSNSYHAQPLDKGKATANTDTPSKSGANARAAKESSDDDDIMIVDHGKGVPGSLNSGSIPSRGMKRAASPTSSQRKPQRPYHQAGSSSGFSQGSSNHPVSSHRPFGNRQHTGPPPTVTGQENLNISDVKLEQITSDELMSLASHVGDERPPGASQSQMSATHSHSQPRDGAMWIKQEAADDEGGGSDAGWSQGKDDSNSNSGSNLHPVMLHQNPAAYSGPVFPGFSGANSSGAPGANPFADPLPGTSQDTGGGLDPSDIPERWTPEAFLAYVGEDDLTQKQLKSKVYEANRRREFVSSWLEEFPWLVYDQKKRKMFCKVCLQHPGNADKRSSFISGNTSFRKHNLYHHAMSTKHKLNLIALGTSETEHDANGTDSDDQPVKCEMSEEELTDM